MNEASRKVLLDNSKLTDADIDYLQRIQKPTFQGFEKLRDPVTTLPVDIASVASADILRLPNDCHFSKTSPTNIALCFLYLILSIDRGYLTEEDTYQQMSKMLEIVEMMSTYENFHYNWYYLSGKKGTQGIRRKPEVCLNDFISSVDNGNLDVALMVTAARFPDTELEKGIERFLTRRNYLFFFSKNPNDPSNGFMNIGYDAVNKTYSTSDYSIFNSEARMASLIAILKGEALDSVWKKQARLIRNYRVYHHDVIPIVASWGGSLFETLFADEIIGGSKVAPKAFYKNALNIIKIHKDKARKDFRSGIWGLSNGEVPGKNRYEMAGVSDIAYTYFRSKFVTIYSSFLSLRYDPLGVVANLKKIEAFNPQSFNASYGFTDSIDPNAAVINENILSLDKGMEVLAIGNFFNRLEGKKEIADYFWIYLQRKGWKEKALELLVGEEEHPSFRSLHSSQPYFLFRKHSQNCLSHFDLMTIPKKVLAFWEPDRAKASVKVLRDEIKRQSMWISYEVKKRYSFCGVSIKYKEVDISNFCSFSFEMKGDGDKGFPVMFKVEMKYKSANIQFKHFRIDRKWKAPKSQWTRFGFHLPQDGKVIDEISIVFENSSIGPERIGEVMLRDMKLA